MSVRVISPTPNSFEDDERALEVRIGRARCLINPAAHSWDTFNGVAQELIAQREHCKQAFAGGCHTLCCIDERVFGGKGVRVPGSGVLISTNPSDETLLTTLRGFAIDSVCSHANCGAAKLALERLKGCAQDWAAVDAFTKDFCKRVAANLGVPYLGHADFAEHDQGDMRMVGMETHHVTRTAYYDATCRFNLSAVTELLPVGFVITRTTLVHKAVEAAAVAFAIATGLFGLGSRITEADPFVLIIVAESQAEAERIRDGELRDVLAACGPRMTCRFITPA